MAIKKIEQKYPNSGKEKWNQDSFFFGKDKEINRAKTANRKDQWNQYLCFWEDKKK